MEDWRKLNGERINVGDRVYVFKSDGTPGETRNMSIQRGEVIENCPADPLGDPDFQWCKVRLIDNPNEGSIFPSPIETFTVQDAIDSLLETKSPLLSYYGSIDEIIEKVKDAGELFDALDRVYKRRHSEQPWED